MEVIATTHPEVATRDVPGKNGSAQIIDMTERLREAGLRIVTLGGQNFADDGETLHRTTILIEPEYDAECRRRLSGA